MEPVLIIPQSPSASAARRGAHRILAAAPNKIWKIASRNSTIACSAKAEEIFKHLVRLEAEGRVERRVARAAVLPPEASAGFGGGGGPSCGKGQALTPATWPSLCIR